MSQDYRPIVTRTIEETRALEHSPFIRGLISGTKGAILGGIAGGVVQAARGRSPLIGALVAAAGTGLITGLSSAIEQEVKNQEAEGDLRFYMERLKEKEPLIFMPPRPVFGRLFSMMHKGEHAHATP